MIKLSSETHTSPVQEDTPWGLGCHSGPGAQSASYARQWPSRHPLPMFQLMLSQETTLSFPKCLLFAQNNDACVVRFSFDSLPEQSAFLCYFSKAELTHIILCQATSTLCCIKKLRYHPIWPERSSGISRGITMSR